VQGLSEFADDDNPPQPLLDALFDPDPGIVLSGAHALADFPNPEAWKPLCDFIDSGKVPVFSTSAILALGEMGDERAVPTLTRVLVDADPPVEQNLAFAAQALARCGADGIKTLLEASYHTDARIRFAAVVGLDVSGEAAATPRLDELQNDPDPLVSKCAKHRVGKPFEI
jgi:HEAT repeat protein